MNKILDQLHNSLIKSCVYKRCELKSLRRERLSKPQDHVRDSSTILFKSTFHCKFHHYIERPAISTGTLDKLWRNIIGFSTKTFRFVYSRHLRKPLCNSSDLSLNLWSCSQSLNLACSRLKTLAILSALKFAPHFHICRADEKHFDVTYSQPQGFFKNKFDWCFWLEFNIRVTNVCEWNLVFQNNIYKYFCRWYRTKHRLPMAAKVWWAAMLDCKCQMLHASLCKGITDKRTFSRLKEYENRKHIECKW